MPRPITRRRLIGSLAGTAALPAFARPALAQDAREITWDDLLPVGVPYGEVVGEGFYDPQRDIWKPEFDANGSRLVTDFDGQRIRLPGYMLPIEYDGNGVTGFILAPYAGACIHVPPPPPNQLVYATIATPWPSDGIFDAVWVTGTFQAQQVVTELADIGYTMTADEIELYDWMNP